jgi:hypothetical protein
VQSEVAMKARPSQEDWLTSTSLGRGQKNRFGPTL